MGRPVTILVDLAAEAEQQTEKLEHKRMPSFFTLFPCNLLPIGNSMHGVSASRYID
ncbi:hypothetical protein J22TS3_31190 [Paenibacillus sp. J22TS3]|nr:hypothetical protein J22TS3_31190 [Paenibacillus sp. J22TS3]